MKIIWEKKEKEKIDYNIFDLKFKREFVKKDNIYQENIIKKNEEVIPKQKEKNNIIKKPEKKMKRYYIISEEYGI